MKHPHRIRFGLHQGPTKKLFGAAFLVALMAACSSTTQTTNSQACGDEPVGGTCKKPSGGCEGLVCVGTTWKCPEGDTPVALTPANCVVADSGVDGSACGQRSVGGTCKKPSGGCEDEICVGTTWKCPDGDTSVALTPDNCATSDGGADASPCGQRPLGGACKKPGGGCENEICVGTTWKCPDGDTPVALTPANCAVADSGGD